MTLGAELPAFIGATDLSWGVAVQNGGRIVAVGSCLTGSVFVFCVARYKSDGALDTSFDGDGKVTTAIGADSFASAVVVQGDGKIVAAGTCRELAGPGDFCLARYDGASPPDAPSNLTATALSRSLIGLGWTDNAANETGFRIERSLDGSSGWRQVGSVAANATTYMHWRHWPLTTSYYRVRATNAAGHSAYSNVASATTLG